MEKINAGVCWYQQKIGAYDKQLWEKSVEKTVIKNIEHVPRKLTKVKTDLIDVDLVRGSTFPKAKPKHSLWLVSFRGILKVVFLPLYMKWWRQQTSAWFGVLLLLLYISQVATLIAYVTDTGVNVSAETLSLAHLLIPLVLMVILGLMHSQMLATVSSHKHRRPNTPERQTSGTKKKRKIVKPVYPDTDINAHADSEETDKIVHRKKKVVRRKSNVIEEVSSSCASKRNRYKNNAKSLAPETSSGYTEDDPECVDQTNKSQATLKRNSHLSKHYDAFSIKKDAPSSVKVSELSEMEDTLRNCDKLDISTNSSTNDCDNLVNQDKVKHLPKQNSDDDNNSNIDSLNKPLCYKNDDHDMEVMCPSNEDINAPFPGGEGVMLLPENADDLLTSPDGDVLCNNGSTEHSIAENTQNKVDDCNRNKDYNHKNVDFYSNNDQLNYETDQLGELPSIGKGLPVSVKDDIDICKINGTKGVQYKMVQKEETDGLPNIVGSIKAIGNSTVKTEVTKDNNETLAMKRQQFQLKLSSENVKDKDIDSKTCGHTGEGIQLKHGDKSKLDALVEDKGISSEQEELYHTTARNRRVIDIQKTSSGQQRVKESNSSCESEGETTPNAPTPKHRYGFKRHMDFTQDLLSDGQTSEMEWDDPINTGDMSTDSSTQVTTETEISNEEDKEGKDSDGFGWSDNLHHANSVMNNLASSTDKVSCIIWETEEVKKVDLTVLDLGWTVIQKADKTPERSDYLFLGLAFALFMTIIPLLFRLHQFKDRIDTTMFNNIDGLIQFGELLIGVNWREKLVILNGVFQRMCISMIFFFLLSVAERTFKQRLLYAKHFCYLTSCRRAKKYDMPHFRLNKVRNIKTWLSLRSYLKKRGPQRSVDTIVSSAFILAVVFVSLMCVELLHDSGGFMDHLGNWELMIWCLALGIYLLRFMTLGTYINKKYRNFSVLITEQINLYLHMEQKPHKKEELMLANNVLKLAEALLKELESPFRISGLSVNPFLYNITKVVILSAFSAVLTELLGFKLKLYKIKLRT